MPPSTKTLRTCPKGHSYYKSSDCPTCPTCETLRAPKDGFLAKLVAPARRALEREGITTVAKLAKYSEREILQLHGIGPSSIPILKETLREKRLTFRKSE
jgi:predicted RecB family nuclease